MSNGIRVAVDSGHGMTTVGKRTPPLPEDLYINGVLVRRAGERIHEKEFNKPTAEFLIAALNRCGFETCNVSPGETDVSLSARTDAANAFGAHCYISKHYNALTMDRWRDSSYFVAFRWKNGKPNSQTLGNMIANEIVAVNGLQNNGCGTDVDYMNCELWVLKRSNADVAVLTESGFMDVWEDAKRMLDPAYQKADAEATCRGICNYYGVPYVAEHNPIKEVVWVGKVNSPDNTLNMREGASMEANVTCVFNNGEFLVVTKEYEGWVYAQGCKHNMSFRGWVGKQYLTDINLAVQELATTNTPDGTVNVRAFPSSSMGNNIVAVMGVEEDFYVIDVLMENPYALILTRDNAGLPILGYADEKYMFRHFVRLVTADALNVRSTPDSSRSDNILMQLHRGDPVEVYNPYVNNGKTWYRVGSSGTIFGYVSGDYLEKPDV